MHTTSEFPQRIAGASAEIPNLQKILVSNCNPLTLNVISVPPDVGPAGGCIDKSVKPSKYMNFSPVEVYSCKFGPISTDNSPLLRLGGSAHNTFVELM